MSKHTNNTLTNTRSATPIFLILFPGYSPSKEIEAYARASGRSPEAGTLTLISMGQGQEGPAEAVLNRWGGGGCVCTFCRWPGPSHPSHPGWGKLGSRWMGPSLLGPQPVWHAWCCLRGE